MRRHPILVSLFFVFLVFGMMIFSFGVIIQLSNAAVSNERIGARDGIAVLKIEGTILESLEVIQKINKIKKNNHIKVVVIRIDSPGGGVSASQEIFEEIKSLKKTKKIVVSMGSVAASGGYYISLAGDVIFANAGTVTGSIGVIMQSMGLEELARFAKLEPRVLTTGTFKDAGSPFKPLSDDDRIYFQGLIDNMYNQFIEAVAQHRKLPLDKVKSLADGRVYTGTQAQMYGLIDKIGTVNDAIEEARRLANLPVDAPVEWIDENLSPLDFLMDDSKKSSLMKLFLSTKISDSSWPHLLFMSEYPETKY